MDQGQACAIVVVISIALRRHTHRLAVSALIRQDLAAVRANHAHLPAPRPAPPTADRPAWSRTGPKPGAAGRLMSSGVPLHQDGAVPRDNPPTSRFRAHLPLGLGAMRHARGPGAGQGAGPARQGAQAPVVSGAAPRDPSPARTRCRAHNSRGSYER